MSNSIVCFTDSCIYQYYKIVHSIQNTVIIVTVTLMCYSVNIEYVGITIIASPIVKYMCYICAVC